MAIKWVVKTFTIVDGFVNTWGCEEENGVRIPEEYDTAAEAGAALDEFLAAVEENFDGVDVTEYIIAPVIK